MIRILFSLICLLSFWGKAQLINEICPSNVTVFETENEGFSDWLEIYNDSPSAIDLADFFISDNRFEPTKWNAPSTVIDEGGYLVLAAADFSEFDETIPFSFGRKGGAVYLANSAGVIIDSLPYPSLLPNHSFGRYDDKQYYFEVPTPEADNETETAFKGYASTPEISRVSGNYPAGTNVTIRTNVPDQTIYYALDGTNPVTAYPYTVPFVLKRTFSVIAVAKGDSLIQSAPIYRTFFVDIEHRLPVVNLNLDSLELLDELIGIYVLGPDASPDYPYYGANFWKDIEIHAFYEYFDVDMVMQESLDCGIKIHGGTVSSTRPMKSLRLVTHDRYEKEEFTYPYFDNKPIHTFKRLLLRNSGSDFNKTHLKDGVLHKFVLDHDLNIDAQAYQPVVVYINGNYWGIHNMREKLDKYYPATNYEGVDPEEVNLLEEEELFLIAGDSAEFIELRDFVLANEMTDQANYDWVAAHLDLNSMVDYFIMEVYVNNRDWPYNNLKLWNSPSHPQWRYFYSDLDAGVKYYGKDPIDFHQLEYILGPKGDNNVHVVILRKMLTNLEFQRYFINRYADLMNTILKADYILPYIYKAKEKIEPEIKYHFSRWYASFDHWNEEFLKYDAFFNGRVAIVQNELSVVFDKAAAVDVYIGMYPSDGGKIQLNSIELDSFPFVGKYYPANLIDLTVDPNEGRDFLYWENLRTGEKSEQLSVQVDPADGDSLIAVFKEADNLFDLELFPNPIVSSGEVKFSVPESGNVTIEVYGMDGQRLAGIEYAYLAKGSYARRFVFSMLKPGTYLIVMHTVYGRESLSFVKT